MEVQRSVLKEQEAVDNGTTVRAEGEAQLLSANLVVLFVPGISPGCIGDWVYPALHSFDPNKGGHLNFNEHDHVLLSFGSTKAGQAALTGQIGYQLAA